jgi:thiamine phosphate synthase YjbQ (UPF0047 family)
MNDLTEQVSAAVATSGIQTGTVNVFNVGTLIFAPVTSSTTYTPA